MLDAAMAPSRCVSSLFLFGLLVVHLEAALGFVVPPTTTAIRPIMFNPSCSSATTRRNHDSCRQPTRSLERRGYTALAAGPPDDFIDTTAVEEEGSSYIGVDFERQELRVIFETMDKNNIFYKMLAEEQITEILQLTQALLSVKQMPVEISQLWKGSDMKGKWKLEFSTEERYKLLPASADIYNYIYDGGGGGRLDNVIRFYKSWFVKSVRAVTNYKMDTNGKIVFEFDKIEADLCGFKLPLPKFASDVGFVEVQYFDGDLWIEAFEAPTMDQSQTMTVLNIYRRIGNALEEDKTLVPERTGEQGQPQR